MKFMILSPDIPNVYRYYRKNASRIDYDAEKFRTNMSIIKSVDFLREKYLGLGLNDDGTMAKGTFLNELAKGNCECILTYFDDTRDPISDGTQLGNYLADGYIVLMPGDKPYSILINDFIVFKSGIGRGTQQYLALEEYIRLNYPEVKYLYGFCPFKNAQPFWKKMGFIFDEKNARLGLNSKTL